MANFQTHVTTSTALGIGFGSVGYLTMDLPWDTCLLAGGLCGVAGMLPDVDADGGTPAREILGFAAAVVPVAFIGRFQEWGLQGDQIAVAMGSLYIVIRFALGAILRRVTVHRGMWHSVPAAAIAGLVTALVCTSPDLPSRLFKVAGVVLGYLSHLALDELYSVDVGRLRVKRSHGTALKFWGKSAWANVTTYVKLGLLMALVIHDPSLLTGTIAPGPTPPPTHAQHVDSSRDGPFGFGTFP